LGLMHAGAAALGGLTHAPPSSDPSQSASNESYGDPFHAAPHVTYARQLDAIALLNRRNGKYVTLGGVGSRIWDLVVAGAATGEIVDRLEEEYDVARERLESDVATALAQLLAGGFVRRGPPAGSLAERDEVGVRAASASKARAFRMPSVLVCGAAIFAVKLSLRIRGFGGTLTWIRRRVEATSTIAADTDTVRRAERAVATAGAFYPGRALCLEQSLALYLVLRSQGVAVTYCQGVQFHPFQAHAWVEYEGEVINDVAPHVKHFARFPDQLP
jgi:hypothetical protein